MKTLFNENWKFAELSIEDSLMEKDGKPNLLSPDEFVQKAQNADFRFVNLPHDWLIENTKELYRNSAGIYKKEFNLEKVENSRITIRFEGVYMNCGIYVNNQKAGEWKYGYSTFEFDISNFVKNGKNLIEVIVVHQNPNSRWYSGAGIFRDVTLCVSEKTFLVSDGTYIVSKKIDEKKWSVKTFAEIGGNSEGFFVRYTIKDKNQKIIATKENPDFKKFSDEEKSYFYKNICAVKNYELFHSSCEFTIENPNLWDTENPYLYNLTTELLDSKKNVIDSVSENLGFRTAVFSADEGFFLNGKHVKLNGACHHHDLGALGSAFDKNALKRQFAKLKEMGVNAVRCSHNPPPKAWLDLADEMGILIDDECFDMWEKPKTSFDYGNYFNDWCERDTANWVRKDRNHPSLIMWSIGNEIYDTHMGNGFEITKKLSRFVRIHDPEKNAPITIASNYMWSENAQNCANEIETVGYNYLERLYDEHHKKYSNWKIYGSETSSTVQSRGIYHFPEDLTLVTYDDQQCSSLGNCTTTWGARSTQATITDDRDTKFSAGQFIWTGWDYIGEPTPYHSKNSFFGQIDTAGFPKDTFFLFKSEWTDVKKNPFVHILPYWDFNENQKIDIKAYTNASSVELFFNGKSQGKTKINHKKDLRPFGQWQLLYKKGELKAVAYDENDKIVAEEIKRSFEDPSSIILQPEKLDTGNLFFVDIMTADKNGTLVENARNYITICVKGDAKLLGLDNGDSTDFDQYQPQKPNIHTRKLFSNRLVAIIKSDSKDSQFSVTAASKDLKNVTIVHSKNGWENSNADIQVKPENDFVPVRKIEIECEGSCNFNPENKQIVAKAKVLPQNASIQKINWNVVLKECVKSDSVVLENSENNQAVLKAFGDGECRLRCTSNNGKDYPEIISDVELSVKGIGNPNRDPFTLIEACRMTDWNREKEQPPVSILSGISNRGIGPTWISFDKVNFGNDGADTIHVPIFTFDYEVPLQIWDGKPEKGECLYDGTYKANYVYNTYTENIFTLQKRLFGLHEISFVFPTELVFQGFYFDKTLKAFSKLRALDADSVTGDSFTKTDENIEGIGNNVNIDFSNMDFGEKGAEKLTICGKSNTENNTINIKFFGENGVNKTDAIEFSHTEKYEEKTFNIKKITGKNMLSFVFLPGCNFDFKWFKFE